MTLLATQFSVTLGAWRVRVCLDVDEVAETRGASAARERAPETPYARPAT